MIFAVLRNNALDADFLERGIRSEAANRTDESVEILRILNKEVFEQFMGGNELADLICVDITKMAGVQHAEAIRKKYPTSPILIVSDASVPPIHYMKPSIMAAGLLLRPLNADMVSETMAQIFKWFLVKEDSNVFIIEGKDEKYRIPYKDILYFEAREKKIYACTKQAEYGFYDTIDQLESRLSEQFVRCHRSYILNKHYLKKVRLSLNCVCLEGDIELPLSRSYKQTLKNLDY